MEKREMKRKKMPCCYPLFVAEADNFLVYRQRIKGGVLFLPQFLIMLIETVEWVLDRIFSGKNTRIFFTASWWIFYKRNMGHDHIR